MLLSANTLITFWLKKSYMTKLVSYHQCIICQNPCPTPIINENSDTKFNGSMNWPHKLIMEKEPKVGSFSLLKQNIFQSINSVWEVLLTEWGFYSFLNYFPANKAVPPQIFKSWHNHHRCQKSKHILFHALRHEIFLPLCQHKHL